MSLFGRSYGTRISGKVFKDGKEIEVRTVHQAIKHGIAYATEDRKRYGPNLIDSIRRNIWARRRQAASRGVVNHNAETQVAERNREPGIKTPNVEALAGKLSAQPAEGRAEQVDLRS